MTRRAHAFDTPLDRMVTVVGEDGAVLLLEFLNGQSPQAMVAPLGPDVEWSAAGCAQVVAAVTAWYHVRREALEVLRIRPAGSPFQLLVWSEVRKVPCGTTSSYGEIAARIGRPGAARAVGRANATNPICLVVPCHRIVGADGSLTGYGGGLATKAALLDLEAGRPLRRF
jgi:methylated-DNA-[protein]-cysteine S-methyltransferase